MAQGHLGCLSNTILIVWQTLMCMPVAIWVWVPMEFLLEARLGPNRLTCRRSRNASCLLPPRGQVIGPTDRRVRLSVCRTRPSVCLSDASVLWSALCAAFSALMASVRPVHR